MRTKKSKIKNRKTKNKYRIKGGVAALGGSDTSLKDYMDERLVELYGYIRHEISELNKK